MPKVSVYMDDDLYEKLKAKAKETEKSLSKLIENRLFEYINGWPQGYFDLFGSWKDCPMEEPEELPWELDAPRKKFPDDWPDGYFEKYIGSVKEDSFEAPEDPPWTPGEGETFDDNKTEGHAKKFFGAIKDESFKVPEERPWSWNSPRIPFDDPDEKDGSKDKKRKTRD